MYNPPRRDQSNPRKLPTPLTSGVSQRRCGNIVQSVSFDFRLRPIAFELEANRRLSSYGAFDKAYFSPARTDVKMVNNLILRHFNTPARLQEPSGYRQVFVPRFLLRT
jgi:hypothetical protein